MSAPSYSERLKARLCRQYIPCIKEFLTDFDISQTSKNEERHDSLGMGFLVETYDEKNKPEDAPILKANCKWKINDVTEQEIYEAIEEFYYITTWKDKDDRPEKSDNEIDYVNTVSGKRDKLLEYLFRLSIDDGQANIADNTIFAIAEYFGLKGDIIQIGNLYRNYECVAYAYYQQIGEKGKGIYDFFNALRLFSSIRNPITHKDKKLGEKVTRYHEFIIFFYIGFVLACRRIWSAFDFGSITSTMKVYNNNTKSERGNKKNTFVCPDYPKHFNIREESVEIYVGPGPRVNVSCKDVKNKKIDVITISKSDNRYSIDICKYKEFIIKISDGKNKPLKFKDKLDYNSWFYCYRIKLPDEWFPSSKDYETLSEGTKQLIASVSKHLKESVNQEIKECIGQEFAALQPLIVVAKDKEEKEKELVTILEKLDQFAKGNFEKLEEIHSLIEQSNNTILTELINARKEGDQIKRILSNWSRNLRGASFLLLVVLPVCLIVYNCCFNNIETNICWIKHRIWYYIIATVLIFLTFYLTNSWNYIKNIKKEKGKLNYWVTGVIALILISSPFFLRYQNVTSLVTNYDFAVNKENNNQEVVSLLEEHVEKSEDFSVIFKLFSYYLLYGNNDEKANNFWTRISKNATKHPEEVIKAAELFLAIGDNTKLKNAIDLCPDNYKDSVVVMRINGIMMAGGYGVDKNLKKGVELLEKASSKGDLEATYWLGHIESSIELQEWIEKDNIKIFIRYDIFDAINRLRKASVIPKAAIELGNIYADLNMNDSAKYYYLKALSIDENSLDAKYQIGRLYDKTGSQKDSNHYNLYLSEAISQSYAPAMLYKAERDSDHTSAIELYKLFDDSIKARKYDKKYREDYRYIRPIVFEYVAAHNPGFYNGLDSAYNYLQKSRPNGHFNIEFVKGIEAMISTDTIIKQSSWKYFRESANKGCLYAKMMCHYKDIMKILRGGELTQADNNTYINKMDSLADIGNEIPFSNVLISWIVGQKNLDSSEHYAHKALIRGHLAGIIASSRNAYYYQNLIDEITLTGHDRHIKDMNGPIQYKKITEENLQLVKNCWISTQLGLRYSPISANKIGFISLGEELSRIIENAYEPEKEYPIDFFHFWCDVAIANHDYLNECNFLQEIIMNFNQRGGEAIEEAIRYIIEETYTQKLIDAASSDMSKHPKATYKEFLSFATQLFERITGRYDHQIDSIRIEHHIRFANIPALLSKYEDHDLLYECSDFFSPYSLKFFKSRLKELPKKEIIDFFGYDIFE